MVTPKPITWYNTPQWILETLVADRRSARKEGHPPISISPDKVFALAQLNLTKPLFIIGAPRSGTTFLGSCIGRIPEISYHFEPIATKAAIRYIYEQQWSQQQAKLFFQSIYGLLMTYRLEGSLRFAEKTPQLSFILPFLSQSFPDAQFIHIIRDGRDAALSYSKKPWLQGSQRDQGIMLGEGYPAGPYPRYWVESDRWDEFSTTSDIHRCIWAWRRFTEAALQGRSMFSPHQYHELRYEEFIERPAAEAEKILDFLGIATASSRQAFLRAVQRAKPDNKGQWKRELSSQQIEQVNQEAGSLLAQLGY